MLSTPASNALLKTLEEPPAHVVFVLATTDPQKVLPTIRSRTQHFEFRLLGPETLGELLEQVRRDAHLDVPDEALDLAVRRGRGSARDALSVLDQVVASDSVDDDLPELDEVVEALAERDVGRALVAVAHLTSAGFSPQQLAGDLVDYLRQGFLALVAPDLVAVPGTGAGRALVAGGTGGTGLAGPGHGGAGTGPGLDAGRTRSPGRSRGGPGAAGPPRGRRLTARRCWPASNVSRLPGGTAIPPLPVPVASAPRPPLPGGSAPVGADTVAAEPAAASPPDREDPGGGPPPTGRRCPPPVGPRPPTDPGDRHPSRRRPHPNRPRTGARRLRPIPMPDPGPAGAGLGRSHHRTAATQGQGAVPGGPVRRGGGRPGRLRAAQRDPPVPLRGGAGRDRVRPGRSFRPAGRAGAGGRCRRRRR